MSPEYATKVIMKHYKHPVKKQKIPPFQLRSMMVAYDTNGAITKNRVYGIKVKANDAQLMMEILKESTNPGNFIPFQLRRINEAAYQNLLTIMWIKVLMFGQLYIVKYMSEGAQFTLVDKSRTELLVEHVMHSPIQKQTQILVIKKEFHSKREQTKAAMIQWTQDLDTDYTIEFETYQRFLTL
jgi:hypothetical protein